jgi:hypothetical protein
VGVNTCATCRHFTPGGWVDREQRITSDAKQWIKAAEQSEWIEEAFDGYCEMASRTNVYDLWMHDEPLPVVGIVEGSPMRTSGDGCCSSLAVRASFGCNAWEAKP